MFSALRNWRLQGNQNLSTSKFYDVAVGGQSLRQEVWKKTDLCVLHQLFRTREPLETFLRSTLKDTDPGVVHHALVGPRGPTGHLAQLRVERILRRKTRGGGDEGEVGVDVKGLTPGKCFINGPTCVAAGKEVRPLFGYCCCKIVSSLTGCRCAVDFHIFVLRSNAFFSWVASPKLYRTFGNPKGCDVLSCCLLTSLPFPPSLYVFVCVCFNSVNLENRATLVVEWLIESVVTH